MKNRNIVKILGIVGGLLIIGGMFLPYVKVKGFSISLWGNYLENKQLYLAIIIIVFGALPIFFNSMNKKIEFSYMSVGALMFFIINQIIGTISDNSFSSLSFGFYMIILGTILVAITTFISVKKENEYDNSNKIETVPGVDSVPLDNKKSEVTGEIPITNNLDTDIQLNKTPDYNLGNISTESVDQNNSLDDKKIDEIPDYSVENNPAISEFADVVSLQANSLNEENNANTNNEIGQSVPDSSYNTELQQTPVSETDLQQVKPNISSLNPEAKPEIDFELNSQENISTSDSQQLDATNDQGLDVFGQPK